MVWCTYIDLFDISPSPQDDWTTLIPEHDSDVLQWVACVNTDKLVVCYLKDVKVRLNMVIY